MVVQNSSFSEQKRPYRDLARIVGPSLVVVGGLFSVIGLISFFSAFYSPMSGMPQYFWCVFIGFPLIAFGAGVTKFAYLGSIARYIASETAPVQRDTFNFVAHGIRPGVKDLAEAIAQGLDVNRSDSITTTGSVNYCSECGSPAAFSAKFCSQCGHKLDVK